MMDVAEAQAIMVAAAACQPRSSETVPLAAAVGRVLACDAYAQWPLPGFDNSAMDGYAVRAAELPGTFIVDGEAAAGTPYGRPIPPGHAVKIYTGAVMPSDVDTVVIVEEAVAQGPDVQLPAQAPGANLRRRGEDLAAQARWGQTGQIIDVGLVTLAAAQGHASLTVTPRPRVALLATGDELVEVGQAPGPGQLIDTATPMLRAQLASLGLVLAWTGRVADTHAALRETLGHALSYDIVLTTGGVSAGERDLVRGVLAELGVTMHVTKVAMKPGKPVVFGIRERTLVFGLPGNPISSWIGFELFVRPTLLAWQGALVAPRLRVPVRVPSGYRKPPGRAHYLRATLQRQGPDLVATLANKQGSAQLTSLAGCDALIEVPAASTGIDPAHFADAYLLRMM